jgi:hypothetical protein
MFMKKWWAISDKVNSWALMHHEPGSTKSKAVDLDQVVSTVNRIANPHGITHPIMTAFEDPPEEGCLDNLGVSQEEMDIVIDTTKPNTAQFVKLANLKWIRKLKGFFRMKILIG